jgi:hypothetical protein
MTGYFQGISFSRLFIVAVVAFSSTFMTVIATALQSTPILTVGQLKEVILIQGVKALSISSAAALSAVVAFFTRPDSVLPANAMRYQVVDKGNVVE